MSLEGKATGKKLRGKINSLDVLCIDAYAVAVRNGFKGTEKEWLESLTEQTKKNAAEVIAEADNAIERLENEETEALLNIKSMAEDTLNIVQTTGDSEVAVMSQKAVTDVFYSLNESVPFLAKDKFTRETLDGGTGVFYASATRIAYPHALTYDNDVMITCESGYKYVVSTWRDKSLDGSAFVSSSPWNTGKTVIPAGTIFTLLVSNASNSEITTDDYNKIKLYRAIDGANNELLELNERVDNADTEMVLIKGDIKSAIGFSAGSWSIAEVSGGLQAVRVANPARQATDKPYVFAKDVKIGMPDYTHYSVFVITLSNADDLIIENKSGWMNSGYVTVPANTPFVATVQLNDEVYTISNAVEALNITIIDSVDDLSGRVSALENCATEEVVCDLSKNAAYASLFNGSGDVEAFLFFTDPHYVALGLNGGMRAGYENHLDIIKKHYDESCASFVLCGGDWLNNGNTAENACYELSKIKGKMRSLFDKYHLLVGNHDTNYQGNDQLSQQTINNLWFNDYGKSYYAFNGGKTKFYVFDSGIDWNHTTSLTDYDNEQIEFFLKELDKNDDKYIALASHMASVNMSALHKLTERITEIARNYNERGTVQHNGVTYDFGQKTGNVEFMIAGHTHTDVVGHINTIPFIQTINADVNPTYPTFDFVLVDYTARKLKTVRVGNGYNREIELN